MDRVADHLIEELWQKFDERVWAENVRPPFRRRLSRVGGPAAVNVDRGLNRLVYYPRHLARIASEYDVFHIVDHSYSQLVHRLPRGRTVVTCHDLDTFRSLLAPEAEPRSAAFRAMTRRILTGFQQAACVTCDTAAIRDELLARQLVPASRLVVAPVGVSEVFSDQPDEEADLAAARLLGPVGRRIDILHVGSTIARKRIEFLLQVLAAVRSKRPEARLVRVGGALTAEQEQVARTAALTGHIVNLPTLDDRTLAAVYRRAAVVLLPSEREGFGLPVAEALGCGTPVVASDLPVLREVGGPAAAYCGTGDLDAWTMQVVRLMDASGANTRPDERAARTAWARRFTWSRFAEQMTGIYTRLTEGAPVEALAESLA